MATLVWTESCSLHWMELRWEERHLYRGYYQAEGENWEILMKDRKDNVIHLLEYLPGVGSGGLW